MLKQFSVYLFSVVVCITLLFGCENQKEMEDPKASLEKLAEEYWTKRLVDKDYEFTYNLELQKESIPFSEYLKRVKSGGQIEILSVKTKNVEIDQDNGIATMTARCRPRLAPGGVDSIYRDFWVLKANQWKHKLPKK